MSVDALNQGKEKHLTDGLLNGITICPIERLRDTILQSLPYSTKRRRKSYLTQIRERRNKFHQKISNQG